MAYYIGVDLGGTNVRSGLVSHDGEVSQVDKRALERNRGRDIAIGNIVKSIRQVIDASGQPDQIGRIGIGSPAPLDVYKGIITFPVNLPELHNTPIKGILEKEFRIPVYLDNDANVAAIGEHWKGAGQGTRHFICLTLGTGIGGGIISHGQVLRGFLGHAAEIGHMSIEHDGPECVCHNRGCLELYASATAIAKRTKNRLIQENPTTLIKELVQKDYSQITAEIVYQAAKAGDAFAIEVFRETGYFLGAGVASLLALFNPEIVAIGGGVAAAGDLLLKPAAEVLDERRWVHKKLNPAPLVVCQLGDHGPLIGAAKMAMDRED